MRWATDKDLAELERAATFWDDPTVKAMLVLRERLQASGRWLDELTVSDIADLPALWRERHVWLPERFA